MRLFIAICLSEDMRAALRGLQDEMRAQRVSGSFTAPENLHLTLAFIGEYPDPEDIPLPAVEPFDLTLDGYGSFGDLWWAGIRPSPRLRSCAAAVRHGLDRAGIPFDGKRFSPHITLVRRAVGVPALVVPNVAMTVDHLSLMRSDRGKRGMVYTEVRRSDAPEVDHETTGRE